MAEAGCMIVLAVLFARIHVVDVRERLVYAFDVAWLLGARAVFVVLAHAGLFSEGRYAACAWGALGAAESLLFGVVVAASMWLLGMLTSHAMGREALGGGDVWLYAACCLFLDPSGVVLFVGLAAASGVGCAIAAWARRRATFPFAPAIVWSCWVALAVRMLACAVG